MSERSKTRIRANIKTRIYEVLALRHRTTGESVAEIVEKALDRELTWWQAKRLAEERKADP